ncbi:hypothetical protein SRABI80_02871 [Peribacillus frigoritolerans]|nr:hypothetical protein SRABI80_02871 [Peribacillus frigoritolerans]
MKMGFSAGYDPLVTKLGLSRDHSSLTEKLYRQKCASNCLGGNELVHW